jgi:NAD(P)-dependent dehydrogenase (short-subunit alcohol dehydrogenase family)
VTARLANKVAVISGGARGLGAAHVRLFAQEGASVVFGDVLTEEGLLLETRLRQEGLDVRFLKLDVTRVDDWAAASDLAIAEYGRLTTLVNNAAIFSSAGTEDLTQHLATGHKRQPGGPMAWHARRPAVACCQRERGNRQHLFGLCKYRQP